MLIWTRFPIPDKFALILPAGWIALFLIAGRFLKWTVGAQTLVKVAFLMVIIGNAIWMTPHAFVATQALAPDDGSLSLPHGELSLGFVTISWSDQAERSEEHTSELQSPCNLVCRLLLEKKKKTLCELH